MKRENQLKVFLEPAEWDELQGSKPVIQLNVSVNHYIGKRATEGPIAVERSSLPCMSSFPTLSAIFSTHLRIVGTVLWSISKSAHDHDVVRNNVADARTRVIHPLFFPSGVDSQQMEKFWHKLQFDPVAPMEVPFKAELFQPPPKRIERLRQLAREGRRRLEHSKRKQKGRPKLVQGIPNDAKKVAPLLPMARGPCLVQTASRSKLGAVDDTTTTNNFKDQGETTRKPRIARRQHPFD